MKHSILVADDDQLLCDTIKTYFESKGYDVRIATDGAAALRMVEAHMPDALLLDVMMPTLDGISVLKTLAHTPGMIDRTILMTNSDSMQHVADAMALGATRYVVKSSLSLDEVHQLVEARLAASQST